LNAKQAEIEAKAEKALHDWMDPGEGNTPSKFAQVVDATGSVIGSAAARSIMASLNAEASHTARAANTATDLLQAQANPIMGLLAGGKRGKGAAIQRLMDTVGPMLMGGNHNATSSPGGADEYKGRRHHE
jgi:hypothetical protein